MQSQTLMPDKTEIQRCWDLLPHPTGTVVRVFARDRVTGEMDGDFARSANEMFHFAENNVSKQVYVCPNPAQSALGTRHKATDVSHWSYLLLDMDPVEDAYDPAPAMEEVLLWLGEWSGRDFSKRRPLIIDSGRGRQAWVRLADIRLDDKQMEGVHIGTAVNIMTGELIEPATGICTRKTARKTMGYWLSRLSEKVGVLHGCKLDTSTSDLPRPMRMPGTFNQKTGRMASVVEPGEMFGGLAQLLVTGTPDTVFAEPDTVRVAEGTPWQKVQHLLTKTAKDYLKLGQEEGGRHKAMWHTARKLNELGISRDEARKALRQANKLRGPNQELAAEEIEHALDTAYGG